MRNWFVNSILIAAIFGMSPKMVQAQHILYTQDENGVDFIHQSIAQYSDDLSVIVGTISPAVIAGQSDIMLMMVDNSGNVLWAEYIDYSNPSNDLIHDDFAGSVMVDNDKNIVVTGYTELIQWPPTIPPYTPHKTVFIAKFDEDGNPINDIVFTDSNVSGGMLDDVYGFDIEQTSEGDYVIVGLVSYPLPLISSRKRSYIAGIDNKLTQLLWNKRFTSMGVHQDNADNWDSFNHILKVPNHPLWGEVYFITGSAALDASQLNYNVLIDSTGNILWQRFHDYRSSGSYTSVSTVGISSLYDNNKNLFYTLFNFIDGSTGEYRMGISVFDGSTGNKIANWSVRSEEDNIRLLVNGMVWENKGEKKNTMVWKDADQQKSIVFSGYKLDYLKDIGRPIMFSIDVDNLEVNWAYSYQPQFAVSDYQNLLGFNQIVQPLHTSSPLQHFYQPKPLIQTTTGYQFSAISESDSNFGLALLNTNVNGVFDNSEKCTFDLPISIEVDDPHQTPFQITPYKAPFIKQYIKFNVFPANIKSHLSCFSSPKNKNLNKTNIKTSNLSIYPNPTSGMVFLKSTGKIEKIEIYTVEGKNIDVPITHSKIDFSSSPSGIYFINLTVDGKKEIYRIIKD